MANFISEGLNTISDGANVGAAQGLRVEMDKIESAIVELITQANWAVALLAKNARPYNHEHTCQIRMVQAIGAVERALQGNG